MDVGRARGNQGAVDALRRRVLEQEALLALSRSALAEGLEEGVPRVLQRACDLTAAALNVPWVEVVRLAPGGAPERVALAGGPLAADVGDLVVAAGRGSEPLVGTSSSPAGEVRSTAAAPIRAQPGTWGVLAAHHRVPEALTTADARFLAETAALLGTALAAAEGHGARDALRQRESLALEAAGDGLVLLDRSGRVTYANPAFAGLLGTTPEALLGVDLHATAHHTRPDGTPFPREECAVVRACATGEHLDTQRELVWRADGIAVDVSATVRPVPADGGPTGAVLSVRDVGAVVRAERAVAESERLYHAVVQSLTEGVLVQDAAGVIVSANPAAARMLRLPEEGIVGRHVQDQSWHVVDEAGAELPSGRSPTAEARHTGRPVRGRVLGVRTGERTTWLRVNAEPLTAPGSSEPMGVVASFSDITSERETLARLEESERRFRLMAENSSDVISTSRADGTYTYVSPAVRRILGWDPADLVGRRPRDFLHPDDVDRSMASREDVLHQRTETATAEVRFRTPDGGYRWVEITGHLASGADGDPELHAALRVIEERRAAESALRASERRFRQAMEHAPLGTALLDPRGQLTDVNHALCELLERSRGELVGRPLHAFAHPEDSGPVRELVGQLLTGTVADFRHEERYLLPGGRTLWARVTCSLLRDDDGLPLQVIAQLEDVTADRQTRQTLTEQALHDPLTGLANRLLAEDRLRSALARSARTGVPVTVLFCDLDGFKAVNDELGHTVGDEVLRRIGDRLAHAVRDRDTVARLGGDEFLVVAEDLDDDARAHLVARLRASAAAPVELPADLSPAGGGALPAIRLGLSVGSATGTGSIAAPSEDHHAGEAAELVRAADAAMYRDKVGRKGE